MKFASKPSSYTKIENIEPEWLLHCEEKDFKKLIRLESVNKKVKDSFEKDWNAEELRKRFLKYA
jgi:hypothetical protein